MRVNKLRLEFYQQSIILRHIGVGGSVMFNLLSLYVGVC